MDWDKILKDALTDFKKEIEPKIWTKLLFEGLGTNNITPNDKGFMAIIKDTGKGIKYGL